MTSYGDPNAGNGYDDEYYRQSYQPPAQNSGRASVPSDDYGYDYSSSDQADHGQYSGNAGGYPAPGGGYAGGDQNGYGQQGGSGYAGPTAGYGDQGYGQGGYDQGYGQAPVSPPVSPAAGRATVGAAAGRATVGAPAAGRASVGAPVAGRASVGTAPAPAGRATVRPAGLEADGDSRPGSKPSKKKSKQKWRNIVLASVAVFVLLAGGGMIGGTYFYDDVREPDQFAQTQNSFVYSANGVQIAKLGGENRILVPMEKLPREVKVAFIAGEDKNFFEHDGIDLWGIARAAWNNLTGGETQGASTITQQYARAAADDLEVTYARKLREAVMARKLEDKYDKEKILGFYVNTAWFGRSSRGVGAASLAFFKKDVDKLTVEEAAVLGAVLKQPEAVEGGYPGYDPQINMEGAKERWNYVLDNMVAMGELDATKRAAMVYPEKSLNLKYNGQNAGDTGIQGTGTGFVIQKYVEKELAAWKITDWRNKGYKITTSIDTRAQKALEDQLFRTFVREKRCDPKDPQNEAKCKDFIVKAVDRKGSVLEGQPKNLIAAGVAIDPTNGRVLAYYGGADGTGIDYAGKRNEGTEWEDGGHPAASSFKMYTMAAAVEAGMSIKSTWDPTPINAKNCKKYDACPYTVQNSGRENNSLPCKTNCTLQEVLQLSLNVPFFKIAKQIGVGKVLKMANAAGINTMWSTNDGKARDLNKFDFDGPDVRKSFDYHVGFGQYPITVLDHATGMATFANHGIYNKPHFVVKVEQKNPETGEYEVVAGTGEVAKPQQRIRREVADEVVGVLKTMPGRYGHSLTGGREAGAKTGTWENGQMKADGKTKKYPGQNSHVWTVGFTSQIATAIWVGNVADEIPLKLKNGNKVTSTGLPADIWERFLEKASKDMKLPEKQLADGTGGNIGEVEGVGDGVSPTPSAPPLDCIFNPNQQGCPGYDPNNPGGGGNPNPSPSQSGTGGGWPSPRPSRSNR